MNLLHTEHSTADSQFLSDILQGLKSSPKRLDSKYFYDEKGNELFKKIMEMEEYYLTNAEMDILENQSEQLADLIIKNGEDFDLIELGAGDATKSVHLLKELSGRKSRYTYIPVDISSHTIDDLHDHLPEIIPNLIVKGLQGEYLDILKNGTMSSGRRKILLFMGANIGNMNMEEAKQFCKKIRASLRPGDLFIIGFDLKKLPSKILAAYNDVAGITRDFNLNLLTRINRELNGDFRVEDFKHYACYDPESGACKSFLISLKKQIVHIGKSEKVYFDEHEYIFMEISQKYSLSDIKDLADHSGFHCNQNLFDKNRLFVDSVWSVV